MIMNTMEKISYYKHNYGITLKNKFKMQWNIELEKMMIKMH